MKIHISMRNAIGLGLNFYEWRKRQPKQMEYSDKLLQLNYETLQEDHTYQKNSVREFICLNEDGFPLDRSKFVLHTNPKEAQDYGLNTMGYGKYITELFSRFKRTVAYRSTLNLQMYRQKKAERKRIKILNGKDSISTPVPIAIPDKKLTFKERLELKRQARKQTK